MIFWAKRKGYKYKSKFWTFVALIIEWVPFRNIVYYRIANDNARKFHLQWLFSKQSDIFLVCDDIIGGGLYISHGYGTTIYARSIGENLHVYQGVTIGKSNGYAPQIGNNVTIYSGAKVVGNIRIGNNVVIGANAVVIRDVPDNSLAVGVPARIILKSAGTNNL